MKFYKINIGRDLAMTKLLVNYNCIRLNNISFSYKGHEKNIF